MRFVDVGNEHRASFMVEQKTDTKHNNTFMAIWEPVVLCNAALVHAVTWNHPKVNQKALRVTFINYISQNA